MEGKFYGHQKLIWESKGVAARGPVEWGDKDKSISLHVAILQDGVTASGWTGNDLPEGATEFIVAAGVEGNGTFKEGPATATGWAFVHGDGIEMYEWTVPVKLVLDAAKAEPSRDEAAGLPEELKHRARSSK
jgi:hypothetical protein